MRVLGIETSCDETAAAVVTVEEATGQRPRGRILSDVVHTQAAVHARFGGVVPELASRDHLQRGLPVLDQALREAGTELRALDGLAVTSGPGLVGALLVGVQMAKSLSVATGLPLAKVNHLEGHLLAVLLDDAAPSPPWLALVVSGGHTSLYEVREVGRYRLLGHTLDDAAGRARGGIPQGQELSDLCASFQEAVCDALTLRAVRAARAARLETLVICGGVAANSRLRSLAHERCAAEGIAVHLPAPRLCTDNGAMIALAGAIRLARGERAPVDLAADPGWRL
ncbi:MAG: tRNA (adenosine(37)-N6)-threonylcarbamoyltransferase complex transferase subunit TsaD [Deltaproteobacteria bacterium]|nr:MAG: tRNA (adenosine(37)-N6)-threonylcarbamoyltransferase complex transferase subunit TsaD [Deltaproteobacteria bacterium]